MPTGLHTFCIHRADLPLRSWWLGKYHRHVATDKHRDPDLEAVVERARTGGFTPALPVEALEIVRRWVDEGGYERALEVIALQDPDLADQ